MRNKPVLFKFHSCTFRHHSYHLPAKDRAVRFRFEIRQYFAVSNQFLYLHCTVTLCKRNDVPPSSAFRCSRRKREVMARYCSHKQEKNVVTGPFIVWPGWLKKDQRTSQVGFNSKYRAVGSKGLCRKVRLRTEFLLSVITSPFSCSLLLSNRNPHYFETVCTRIKPRERNKHTIRSAVVFIKVYEPTVTARVFEFSNFST